MTSDERSEKYLADLRQRKRALEDLLDHPGFKLLRAVVNEQSVLRRQAVFSTQINDLSDCFAMARAQGEIAGIQAFEPLAMTLLNDVSVAIKDLLQEMDKEGHDE